MIVSKDKLLNEYHQLLKTEQVLRNQKLDLRNFSSVASTMSKLLEVTLKLEIILKLLKNK